MLETIFIQNGGIPLETPVFELEDILLNKYDDMGNKLIFKIEKYSSSLESEKYSLRYDLTIPLKRFILENGIQKIRRYSIGKVYRKDQPSEGRFREFYQGDFDIINENNSNMINEFILLKIAVAFLNKCNINNYKIFINDTNNLKYLLISIMNISNDKLDRQIIISDMSKSKKLIKEINYCIEHKIRYMYIIGENELINNKIIFKDLYLQQQQLINI